jgi:hypothetical protein
LQEKAPLEISENAYIFCKMDLKKKFKEKKDA